MRERDEELVEPVRSMLDNPPLEPCVESDYGAARGAASGRRAAAALALPLKGGAGFVRVPACFGGVRLK